MQQSVMLFLGKVCCKDCLPYALSDISAHIENDWNYFSYIC